MFVISHRGYRNRWPENTLGAFDDAIRFGESNLHFRGIELDVHLTADGEVVVMHNPSLWVADGREWVLSQTPYSRLVEYTGKCSDPLGRICPRFEEVLQLIDHRTPLLCEIKAYDYDPAILVRKLQDLLKAYKPDGDIILHSFSADMMERVITNIDIDGIQYGFLIGSAQAVPKASSLLDRLDYIHPQYRLLESETETIVSLGKRINTWTVNDADTMRRILSLDTAGLLEGIMTDDISLVRCM